jgi:hypothetical protein
MRRDPSKLFRTACLFLSLSTLARSEVIPAERRIHWSPGIPGGFPEPMSSVNVRDYGARGDGKTDDSNAFALAIQDYLSDQSVLAVPAGTYLLQKTLAIDKRIVLRGEGPGKTRLIFDFGGRNGNCIEILKYNRGSWVKAISGFLKDSKAVVVQDAGSFQAGDFAEIQQANDSTRFYFARDWYQYWAQNAVGQICRIESIRGDTLFFTDPLTMDFSAALNPVIRSQDLIQNAGIEDLGIVRRDDGLGHAILLKNAAYCRIKGIESADACQSHVFLETAYRCEIVDSYFHGAHRYTGGDFAFGAACSYHSTNNLIENNIFRRLTHSMLVNLGACGNVFGYNYSFEAVTQGTITYADAVVHGFFPHHNLFESNVVQEISAAESGGPAGPGNTFFRNRIESKGLEVTAKSDFQNVVGNVLDNEASSIAVDPGAAGALVHGNRVHGTVQWDAAVSDHDLPASYYLDSKPPFLGDLALPVIDPAGDPTIPLPAQKRYAEEQSAAVPAAGDQAPLFTLSVFPNPLNGSGVIRYGIPKAGKVSLAVYDLMGRRIQTVMAGVQEAGEHRAAVGSMFRSRELTSGIYVLILEAEGTVLKTKFTIVK